jgi:hypothetical protein
MSVTGKNDRYNNYDRGVVEDVSVKGHHRLVNKVDGIKKYIDIYTTRYTPGSSIRCAMTGHYFSEYKVGSCNEDYFFKVCLSGIIPECPFGKFLYYSSPNEYENHFNTEVTDETKYLWNLKFERRKFEESLVTQMPLFQNVR